jgi:hypothetical protein
MRVSGVHVLVFLCVLLSTFAVTVAIPLDFKNCLVHAGGELAEPNWSRCYVLYYLSILIHFFVFVLYDTFSAIFHFLNPGKACYTKYPGNGTPGPSKSLFVFCFVTGRLIRPQLK